MLHKPFDRHFIVPEGSVMTSGHSLGLSGGVIGLFDTTNQTRDGLPAVSSFAGQPKSKEYVLKMGSQYQGVTRSHNNKNIASLPFNLSQVVAVRASAPTTTEQTVDEVVLGYNGIDESTAIKFKKGDRKAITLELCGDLISYYGYPTGRVTIEYVMEAEQCDPFENCEECDDCESVECNAIILKAVEYLQNFPLRGGVKLSEAVEITPVRSCETTPELVEKPYDFYQLTVADLGDGVALNSVQAQYPGLPIVRKRRTGILSTYEIVAPQGTVLADYVQPLGSLLKGCEDCPEGYDVVEGGYIYAISLADGGDDETATIQALPNAVNDSAIKNGQNDGVGLYSVVLTEKLTDAQLGAFIASEPTATVYLVGKSSDACSTNALTETSWVVTGTCRVSEERYKITVPDTNCGESRLSELEEAFPYNRVALNGTNTRAVTLTGESGTANIAVNGVDYLATFDTDLPTTAGNFVTAHGAALEALGITVTADAAVLTFTGAIIDFSTVAITNATGDLAGTLGALEQEVISGGCSTEYVAIQTTNMVCEQCDPIFEDFFRSEPLEHFMGIAWTKLSPEPNYSDCLCGIKFKGKPIEFHPNDTFLDHFEHLEDSVKIQVSGGYITEQREAIGRIKDEPMAVTYLSRWSPRTHVGGNMRQFERSSNFFFDGIERSDSLVTRSLLGQETRLESDRQYVDIAIEIADKGYSQSMSQRGFNHTAIYHIIAPFGKHQDVLDLANLIATGAGLPVVTV